MARRARPDLHGRVVVVSGADSAAGAAQARALAAVGATLVLCGTDAAALGVLAGSIVEAGGRAGVFVGAPNAGADGIAGAEMPVRDADALAEMVAELFPDAG